MRVPNSHATGQRQLDSRTVQQSACSCSYPIQSIRFAGKVRLAKHVADAQQVCGRRPRSACGAWSREPLPPILKLQVSERGQALRCAVSGARQEPGAEITGYTPANYISFSEDPKDVACHSFTVTVNAPVSICFNLWNDWNRLVEFLDLVAQIGLDPNNPELALFQCFYRHGILPVMEIVFVLQRTNVVQDSHIDFESVWGMPLAGSVTFTDLGEGRTSVELSFAQSLPDILVDLKVGVIGLCNSLALIFPENMEAFKQLAEQQAADPSSVPPRQEATPEIGFPLFDEEEIAEEFLETLEAIGVDTAPMWQKLQEEMEEEEMGEGQEDGEGERKGEREEEGEEEVKDAGEVEDEEGGPPASSGQRRQAAAAAASSAAAAAAAAVASRGGASASSSSKGSGPAGSSRGLAAVAAAGPARSDRVARGTPGRSSAATAVEEDYYEEEDEEDEDEDSWQPSTASRRTGAASAAPGSASRPSTSGRGRGQLSSADEAGVGAGNGRSGASAGSTTGKGAGGPAAAPASSRGGKAASSPSASDLGPPKGEEAAGKKRSARSR